MSGSAPMKHCPACGLPIGHPRSLTQAIVLMDEHMEICAPGQHMRRNLATGRPVGEGMQS